MEQENQKKGKIWPAAAAAAVLVAGGIGAYALTNGDKQEGPAADNGSVPANGGQDTGMGQGNGSNTASGAGSTGPSSSSAYRDGTYTATGDYVSPGGPEQVEVELTIKGGVVTDAEFTPKAERPISVNMQNAFAGGYKALVVGKSIEDISLTKVSGSSLTPQGWNDAVEKIKAQAAIQAS